MDAQEIIEEIWERSGHGTRRIDIERAFNAGLYFVMQNVAMDEYARELTKECLVPETR